MGNGLCENSPRKLKKNIAESEKKISAMEIEIRSINDNVSHEKNVLKNVEVLERSGVVNLFKKIIESGILKSTNPDSIEKLKNELYNDGELFWSEDCESVSLVFGFHGKVLKVINENIYSEKEAFLYCCTFGVNNEKEIVFDENEKNNYQKEVIVDTAFYTWQRSKPAKNLVDVCSWPSMLDIESPKKIEDLPNGIRECVKKVILTFAETEKINVDMQKLEEIFINTKKNNKTRRKDLATI